MSSNKKLVRQHFREAVYKRDGFRCAMCGMKSSKDMAEKELDAHHIISRDDMPEGGYVKENGISLCPGCHQKAEEFHSTGTAYPEYSSEDLFKKISSDYERAFEASKKLK